MSAGVFIIREPSVHAKCCLLSSLCISRRFGAKLLKLCRFSQFQGQGRRPALQPLPVQPAQDDPNSDADSEDEFLAQVRFLAACSPNVGSCSDRVTPEEICQDLCGDVGHASLHLLEK